MHPPLTKPGKVPAGVPEAESGELALAMGGGGARAAYQAGFLRALSRFFPEMRFPILTGVSAGAINSAFLASHRGTAAEATERLTDLWSNLRTDQVFESGAFSLGRIGLRWGMRLFSGGSSLAPPVRGLVDTTPLREVLRKQLRTDARGRLVGVSENLAEGKLKAFALTTTLYATGQSVTWVQGEIPQPWNRAHRVSRQAELTYQHVMASAALPLFFPAVRLGDEWHGDGGIRQTAPLSPALHLGAKRILVVSTRYQRSNSEVLATQTTGYPPPAQVLGVLMNAIFLDMFDYDAMTLERMNQLVEELPAEKRLGLRPAELMLVRPSVDLGKLAGEHELELPRSFRFLTRGLGTRETKSPDSLSMVLFEPEYVRSLIRIGEEDAERRRDDLTAFLRGEKLPSLVRTGFWRVS